MLLFLRTRDKCMFRGSTSRDIILDETISLIIINSEVNIQEPLRLNFIYA